MKVSTNKAYLRLIFLALFGVLTAFFFLRDGFSQEAAVPADFQVIFTSSPAVPVKDIDVETLTIGADGDIKLSAVARYAGQIPDLTRQELPEESLSLDPVAIRDLMDAIEENNFFGLKANYNDPNILDGDWAELTITAGGRTHTVRTRNIKVTAFDNITMTINGFLPEERRLKYNAINGADYEEVER